MPETWEKAFGTVIETHLLTNMTLEKGSFDPERAIFPEVVLDFIRKTQPKEWTKLEALHGDKTGEQILGDLCWHFIRRKARRSGPHSEEEDDDLSALPPLQKARHSGHERYPGNDGTKVLIVPFPGPVLSLVAWYSHEPMNIESC